MCVHGETVYFVCVSQGEGSETGSGKRTVLSEGQEGTSGWAESPAEGPLRRDQRIGYHLNVPVL